jgi:hypothetical protein
VFENRVLREILRPERDEVTGEWRKLLNEEFSDLYCSPNIVVVIQSRMRWTGHVARMGDRKGVCRVLVGRPEGESPLRRSKCRWEDRFSARLLHLHLHLRLPMLSKM